MILVATLSNASSGGKEPTRPIGNFVFFRYWHSRFTLSFMLRHYRPIAIGHLGLNRWPVTIVRLGWTLSLLEWHCLPVTIGRLGLTLSLTDWWHILFAK
jgi:hypothetical protein